MTIQRVTSATEIKAGQWINKGSIMIDGICGYARRVVKASGQRVYYTNRHGEDEGEYCAKSSVEFVSDTRAEAQSLQEVSVEQMAELKEAKDAIFFRFRAKIDDLIKEAAK